ncbi:MAG: glycosyltransferase family 4 protein [Anaerolineae bacterium]|nr:glycosyltransferase family 4 protein [Anaerolineae bacterium]
MRILLANKYYYLRSGTERYMFNATRLLEKQGHEIIPFAMHHPRNRPTAYARHFIDPVDFHRLDWRGWPQAVQRVIYYRPAAKKLAALLNETRPELVQLHNIYHHISPAILPEITRRNIPVIHSLHDYKRICPNYLLLAHGSVCQRCRGHRYYHAPLQGCLHGSLSWSLVAGLAAYIHHWLRIYQRHVTLCLVPSRFMYDKMIAFGADPARIKVIGHFLFLDAFEPDFTPGSEIIYVGRLSPEKGLRTLLRAMRQLPHLSLTLIGEGPQRPELERLALDLPHVRFAGYLAGAALQEAVRSARLVVVPSEWYEVFGQVVIEAFALGKAVVAANIGGLPELVDDHLNGRLFTPGDADELAHILAEMAAQPARLAEMGRAGRCKVARQFSPEIHYARLLDIYRQCHKPGG